LRNFKLCLQTGAIRLRLLEIQRIGDKWANSNASVVLCVSTSVLPVEFNYLINIKHPDFSKVVLGEPQKFAFDERLYKNE